MICKSLFLSTRNRTRTDKILSLNQACMPIPSFGLIVHPKRFELLKPAFLAQYVCHSITGACDLYKSNVPGGTWTLKPKRWSLNPMCLPISPRALTYLIELSANADIVIESGLTLFLLTVKPLYIFSCNGIPFQFS